MGLYIKFSASTTELVKALKEAKSASQQLAEALKETAQAGEKAGEATGKTSKKADEAAKTFQALGNRIAYVLPVSLYLGIAMQRLSEQILEASRASFIAASYATNMTNEYLKLRAAIAQLPGSIENTGFGIGQLRQALIEAHGTGLKTDIMFFKLASSIGMLSRISGASVDTLGDMSSEIASIYHYTGDEIQDAIFSIAGSFSAAGVPLSALNRETRRMLQYFAALNIDIKEGAKYMGMFYDISEGSADSLRAFLTALVKDAPAVLELKRQTGGYVSTAQMMSIALENALSQFDRLVQEAMATAKAQGKVLSINEAIASKEIDYTNLLVGTYKIKQSTAAKFAAYIATAYRKGIRSLSDFDEAIKKSKENLKNSLLDLMSPIDMIRAAVASAISFIGTFFNPLIKVFNRLAYAVSIVFVSMSWLFAEMQKSPIGEVVLFVLNLVVAFVLASRSAIYIIAILREFKKTLDMVKASINIASLILTKLSGILTLTTLKIMLITGALLLLGVIIYGLVKGFRSFYDTQQKVSKQSIEASKNIQKPAEALQKSNKLIDKYQSTIKTATSEYLKKIWDISNNSSAALANMSAGLKKKDVFGEMKDSLGDLRKTISDAVSKFKPLTDLLAFLEEKGRNLASGFEYLKTLFGSLIPNYVMEKIAEFNKNLQDAGKYVQDLIDKSKQKISYTISFVLEKIKNISDWVNDNIVMPIKRELSKLFSAKLLTGMPLVGGFFKEASKNLGLETFLSDLKKAGLSKITEEEFNKMVDIAASKSKDAKEFVANMYKEITDYVRKNKITSITSNTISQLVWQYEYLYDVLVGHSIIPELYTNINKETTSGLSRLYKNTRHFLRNLAYEYEKTGDNIYDAMRIVSYASALGIGIGVEETGGGTTTETTGTTQQAQQQAISSIQEFIKNIGEGIINLANFIKKPFTDVFNWLKSGIDWLKNNIVTPVANWFKTTWDNAYKAVSSAVSGFANWFNQLGQTIFGGLWKPMTDSFSRGLNNLFSGVANIFGPVISNFFKPIAGFISAPFQTLFGILSKIIPFEEILNGVFQEIAPAFQEVTTAIKDVLGVLVNALKPSLQPFAEIIKVAVMAIGNALIPVIRALVPVIYALKPIFEVLANLLTGVLFWAIKILAILILWFVAGFSAVWNAFISIIQFLLGWLLGDLSKFYIDMSAIWQGIADIWAMEPTTKASETETAKRNKEVKETKLASGGVVTRPIRALIGEKGPEAVIPLKDIVRQTPPTQIVVNVSGNYISSDYDVDRIADRIVRELRVRGVTP